MSKYQPHRILVKPDSTDKVSVKPNKHALIDQVADEIYIDQPTYARSAYIVLGLVFMGGGYIYIFQKIQIHQNGHIFLIYCFFYQV